MLDKYTVNTVVSCGVHGVVMALLWSLQDFDSDQCLKLPSPEIPRNPETKNRLMYLPKLCLVRIPHRLCLYLH